MLEVLLVAAIRLGEVLLIAFAALLVVAAIHDLLIARAPRRHSR